MLDEIHTKGEKALIFLESRIIQDYLAQLLKKKYKLKAQPNVINGEVPNTQRQKFVDDFQTEPEGSFSVMIVSPQAGGVGFTMTNANHVIHLSRWWNPAVEDQATDRAWRLGQERTVNVHKLVCEGTVEERIGQVIDDKRKLADAVVGTGEAWLSELSTNDLRDLVVLEQDD